MKTQALAGLVCQLTGSLALIAQATAADLSLRVTSSPTEVTANATLSYTLALTNIAGFTLSNIVVSNRFSGPATFDSATNNAGTFSNQTGLVTFHINSLTNTGGATLSLRVRPTSAGTFTNAVTAVATNGIPESTNVVTLVSTAHADLAAGVILPSQAVVLNDWIVYGIAATNLGPSTAPNVVLSNTLPAGWVLLGVNPSGQNVVTNANTVAIQIGTLANQASVQYQIRAQAATAGAVDLAASVSASGLMDTNSSNDTQIQTLTVSMPGLPLTATNLSNQGFNPQTGLMTNVVRVTNPNGTNVAAARLILGGLTNRLFNAVGTNDGHPFVVLAGTLAAGQSADLTLEIFNPARVAGTDPVLTAYGVPLPDLSTVSNSGPAILLMTNIPPGRILIEFQSVPGRFYTILYADSVDFTNVFMAQPPVQATANRLQWIDEGPPKTSSSPAIAPMRYYRVIETPP